MSIRFYIVSGFLSSVLWSVAIPALATTTLGGLGGRPVNVDTTDDSQQSVFRYTLRPGDSETGMVEVINNTDKAMTVNLYPADSTRSSDGSFAVEQLVESRDEIGAWISLEQSQVFVPALSSVEVPFTITLPTDQALTAGDYHGGIMMETADQTGDIVGNMTITTRVGVRVYLTIPGDLREALTITDFSITPLAEDSSVLDVMIAVRNDGNIHQDATLRLTADMLSPWPRWLGRQSLPNQLEANIEILSGQTTVRHFTVQRPWLGRLEVEAYVLHHTSQGDETLVTPALSYLRLPSWYVLLIVGIYLLAFIVLEIRQHRRRRKYRQDHHTPTT